MKGESLYEVWVEEMEKQGVSVDSWGALMQVEKNAWNGLAKFIEDLLVKTAGRG
jgi:hypothetical protein